LKYSILTCLLVSLVGCSDNSDSVVQSQNLPIADINGQAESEQRWYTAAQIEQGAAVFASNCAVCHGDQAQGLTENWRERLPDGNFPAPPLNGSAHAWHHSRAQLTQTIETGGEPFGGQMPPFDEILSDAEKLAAIAFFQSFWNEEIYLGWLDIGGLD
jgi:mono/diheme cytochrome c family protein